MRPRRSDGGISVPFLSVGWNVWNQALPKRLLLFFSGFLPDVHKLFPDPHLPDQRIVAQAASQGPLDIEPPYAEHPLDRHRLALAGAVGYPKLWVDVDQLHVGGTLGIIQHIRPADGSDNPAGPDFRPASLQRRWLPLSEGGYPLKLAWAITIHKSQGLTFERAIVDAEAAFAHGQVYVALSRCKSFEGIVLRSRISGSSVSTDPVVQTFSENAQRLAPSESQLQQAKREFQESLVQELFRFDAIENGLNQLCSTYAQHAKTVPPQDLEQAESLARQTGIQLFDVAAKFAPRLADYLGQASMPDPPIFRRTSRDS